MRPPRRQGARADRPVHPHAPRRAARRRRARADPRRRPHRRRLGQAADERRRRARRRLPHRRALTEGFYYVRDGVEAAIARGLAYAPYADLVWMETSTPDSARPASSRRRSTPSSPASCSPTTARRPSTGGATSTTTRSSASSASSARWATASSSSPRRRLRAQRVDVRAACGYAAEGMPAYVRLQEREFALEEVAYTATKHQREVGAGWFDEIAQAVPAARARRSRSGAPPRRPSSERQRRLRALEAWHSPPSWRGTADPRSSSTTISCSRTRSRPFFRRTAASRSSAPRRRGGRRSSWRRRPRPRSC